MSHYSVADIQFEIENLELDSTRMKNFQVSKVENVDIQYKVVYMDDEFSCKKLNLTYKGKLFDEYEDENDIYRILNIYAEGKKSQLVIMRPRKKQKEWKLLLGQALKEKYSKYFDFANHLAFENVLADFQGFILHASIVSYKQKGILFSAPSGTGKSTQGELWTKYRNAKVLNGDRAFIRKINEKFYAYGSPLAGSSGIYMNEKVRVNGIVILKQAPVNTIRRLNAKEAFLHIYKETLMNAWDKEFVDKVVAVISELIEKVPIYELACRPDEEAVELVYETIIGGYNEEND